MGIIPIQTDELKKILIEKRVGRVILADPTISEELMLELIYECRKENAVFELLPHFQELLKGRAELSRVGNFNLLAIRDVALKEWQRVVKRAMDITISILVILALLPFFLIVALLIKLTSPGPVFYKQVRVGRNGRRFFMYKFRSMYEDADSRVDELLKKYQVASLALIKFKHDPRVTPIGRFLRKYSIDEFPQLINVLKGEMSLVGPRPPLVREVEMYEKWQLKRVDVVPGMTGLWQISGRSDTTFEEMVKLDLEYISNWSIWLDIKILLATPIVVLKGKGAY
jgi:exopolysaccharide biosynthesis polyprenyl glycosylphosphotransferase